MQALSQSAFLQALGYAIANSLWQAALLWLLAALCTGVIKMPARFKYKVTLAAQFGVFVWFLVTLQFYYVRCSLAAAQLQYQGNGNPLVVHPGMGSFASASLAIILKGEMLLPYLSVAYLCLLIAFAVRWVKGYRQTLLIKTTGLQKIDVEWRLFVQRIANLIGIKKPVQIYISQLVKSPLTIGFLKPLILVPLASINNLTTSQLEAVILHELAHIRRADYFVNIILSIIETALFFNPFTHLLGKIIKTERENSCDDWVLQFQYDPSAYAEALLRIAYQQHAPALAMNAAAGKEQDLLWRVKRMLNQQEKSFQYRNRLVALLMITGILTSVAWFHPAIKAEAPKPIAKGNLPIVIEPMATQVNNPLFNPLSFLNKPLQAEMDKAVEDARVSLEDASELALDKTSEVLEKVVPAALEGLQTVKVHIPQIVNSAGNVTNEAVGGQTDWGVANDKSGLKDSLNIGSIIDYAVNSGLKNVDWKSVKQDIKAAKDALANGLGGKKQSRVVGDKIGAVVLSSIKKVTNSIFKVNVNQADDVNDGNGDDELDDLNATGAAGTKATPASKRARAMEARQKALQAKHIADSVAKLYSRLKPQGLPGAQLYAAIMQQFDRQTQPTVQSAPMINTFTTNYLPVKFDENLPYNLSVGAANNITVTSKGRSTLIAVKEEAENTGSYRKRITIETLDSTGQKHIFHVTFEMYQ